MDFSESCLAITTGLTYTLYYKDQHDKMLICAMNTYNKMFGKQDYSYNIQEFTTMIGMSKDITSVINKIEFAENEDELIQINSIIFLYSILDTYPNLKKLSFIFSNDDFDRITKDEIGNKEDIFNFQISITDIVFDASTFFTKELIEIANKELIKAGKLSNSYLNRSAYTRLKWKDVVSILSNIGADKLNTQEIEYWAQFVAQLSVFFGENSEEMTNVLYITDYIMY